jgi:hypothetical protein
VAGQLGPMVNSPVLLGPAELGCLSLPRRYAVRVAWICDTCNQVVNFWLNIRGYMSRILPGCCVSLQPHSEDGDNRAEHEFP